MEIGTGQLRQRLGPRWVLVRHRKEAHRRVLRRESCTQCADAAAAHHGDANTGLLLHRR
jgi:hypothetical protein